MVLHVRLALSCKSHFLVFHFEKDSLRLPYAMPNELPIAPCRPHVASSLLLLHMSGDGNGLLSGVRSFMFVMLKSADEVFEAARGAVALSGSVVVRKLS